MTRLTKYKTHIRLTLEKQCRKDLYWMLQDQTKSSDAVLAEVLERHLCNGWEWIYPEDIGALTDAPIISDEIDRDDSGNITKVETVYWYPDYQVLDPSEELYKHGHVDFVAVT